MDLIELRTLATVVSFLVFLGILWWAYGGSQSKHFAEASRIPFDEDDATDAKVLPFRSRAPHPTHDQEARK